MMSRRKSGRKWRRRRKKLISERKQMEDEIQATEMHLKSS